MEAIEDLKRSIRVTKELQSLVKTMKVLAGLNIRQYERAAHAVSGYCRTIELGLQVALKDVPDPVPDRNEQTSERLGSIIFGSDQGMCGQLNDLIVAHAARALKRMRRRHRDQTVMAVGQRVSAQLADSGWGVEATVEVPGSTMAIGSTVHDILRRIDEWRDRGIEMVALFYCRLLGGVFYRASGTLLLPLDIRWIHGLKAKRWPSKVLPAYSLQTDLLFQSLIREYLFVSLFRAFAESLASENAARLASMQVAERNIEERLKALTADFHQCRQTAVTSELLDIISAFEALKPGRRA